MKKHVMAIASGVGIFLIIFFVTDGPSYLVDYQDIVLKFDRSIWPFWVSIFYSKTTEPGGEKTFIKRDEFGSPSISILTWSPGE